MINRFLLAVLVLFLLSCSENISRTAGLYTKTVEGRLTAESTEIDPDKLLIVACGKARGWMTFKDNTPSYRNCRYVFASADKFVTLFESNESEITILAYYAGYTTVSGTFSRSLGIGSYNFAVKFLPSRNWENEYRLLIKPYLNEIVNSDRIRISIEDRGIISKKMETLEKNSASNG